MRLPSLLIGFVAILLALWVIVGEQITGASSGAVINARLTTVRAPISGTLEVPFRPFGSLIEKGDQVASVTSALAESKGLREVQVEAAAAAAELEALRALSQRRSDRLASSTAALEEVTRAGWRDIGPGTPERVTRAAEPARADASDARQSEAIDVAALSPERLYEMRRDAESTETALIITEARHAALLRRLEEEQVITALHSSASLPSPARGALWEVLADDGEEVQAGQEIMRLMKCESAIVTVSVPENIYNRVSVGQEARFRLDGERQSYTGTVTRIAGSGSATIYRNLAVAPRQRDLEFYNVTLLVPELRRRPEPSCSVGRTGRVFFDSRPLDWLRGLPG